MMDLSPQNLLAILATSLHDENARRTAEQQLLEWEKVPGFHAMLQEAYFDESLPFEARYQAIIYLKNCVPRNWRRTSSNALEPDEKALIRGRLFDRIGEPKRMLASQCTVIVAKIARIDYPRDWPSLFDELHAVLDQVSNDGNGLYNAYDVLTQVIKTLAKVKIGRKKADMQDKVGLVINGAIDRYTKLVDQWTQTGDERQMRLSALILKCLCSMLVQGYEHVNRHQEPTQLFNGLVRQYQQLTQLESPRNELVEKHIKTMGKMFMRLAEAQPASFVMLDRSTEIAHYCMQLEPGNDDEESEQAAIRGLSLVRTLIKTRHGSNAIPRRGEEDRQEAKSAQQKLANEVFTEEFVLQSTIKLLTHGMIFRAKDFDAWQDDPEEFFLEGQRITWEHQLRTCAGLLFGDFVIHFRHVVGEKVAEYIQSTLSGSDDPIQLEAALHALQQGSSELVNQLAFNDLFVQQILPLCSRAGQMFAIVRRRVCRLLSEWVSIDCNNATRKAAFQVFEEFLKDGDLVVQLETMAGVRHMVDDWQFDVDLFLPHANVLIQHLFRLVSSTDNVETQSALLNTLSVLIDQTGQHMEPYFGSVIQLLPASWQIEPLQPVVLQIVTSLVSVVGEPAVDPALPILREVFSSGNSNSNSLLVEDALPLWQAVLSRCETARDDVMQLLPLLVDGLQTRTELFTQHLDVLEEYILMDHGRLIREQGNATFWALGNALDSCKSDTVAYICKTLDTLALVARFDDYAQAIVKSGLFASLGRQAMNDELEGFNTVKVFGVFARMAISNASLLWQLVENNTDWWHRWVDQFDRIGAPNEQKLHALGLTAMIGLNDPKLVDCIGPVVGIWYMTEQIDNDNTLDHFEDGNERAKADIDPVYTWPLKQQIKQVVEILYTNDHSRKLIESLGDELDTLKELIQ